MVCVVRPTLHYSINYLAFLKDNDDLVNKFLNYFASARRLLHTTPATAHPNSQTNK